MVTIRNDGSRIGEIRNSTIGVYESEPSDIDLELQLAHCSINGKYDKGEPVQVSLKIAYVHRGRPDTISYHRQVTKLVAILKWNREIRKGFSPDIQILHLLPEPQIQD
jgi:hypothetical protein